MSKRYELTHTTITGTALDLTFVVPALTHFLREAPSPTWRAVVDTCINAFDSALFDAEDADRITVTFPREAAAIMLVSANLAERILGHTEAATAEVIARRAERDA